MANKPNKLDLAFVVEDGHCMPVDDITALEVFRLMAIKGFTTHEMARRVKRSASTVRKLMREHGIAPAERKEPYGSSRYESPGQRENRLRSQRAFQERATRCTPSAVQGEG